MGKLLPKEDLSAHKTITLEITPDELEKKKEEIAKIFQRTRRVPGFRPGKAPLKLVMARYEKEIEAEALDDLAYHKVMDEIEKNVYDYIPPVRLRYTKNDDGSYFVEAEFDVIPMFSFPDLSKVKVEKRVKRITRADVEEELESYRKAFGKFKEVDRPADEGDYVFAHYEEIDPATGKVLRKEENGYVHLEWGKTDQTVYENLKGAKKGDTITIDRKLAIEGGEKLPFKQVFKVVSIKELELPDLNDEFARLQGFESLDEMKNSFEENLRKDEERRSEDRFEWDLIEKIYERIGFELPQTLIDREKERLAKTLRIDAPPNEKDKILDDIAKHKVKEYIILRRFIDQNDIKISDEDVIKHIEDHLEDKSNLEQVVEKYKKEKRFEDIRRSLQFEKAYEMLKNLVKMEVVIE